MLYILSLALGAPIDEAQTALAARGPHRALYHKRSTGKPVLEVVYRGPRQAIARVTSPDGTFTVAVDATTTYTRVDAGTCVRLEARTLFEQARFAGLELDGHDGPPVSQLFYQVAEDGQVQLGSSFSHEPDAPLFSWHDDFSDLGVEVKVTEDSWQATSPITTWTVRRADGLLASMEVGDDGLQLAEVTEVGPETIESICSKTTDPAVGRALETQLRLIAALPPQMKLAEAWPTLAPERRSLARERQTDWWRAYFQVELPGLLATIQGGDWQQALLTGLADQEQFVAFVQELPEGSRGQAVRRWQEHWFATFGGQLVDTHVEELRAGVLAPLGEAGVTWPPEVQQALLVEPMKQAMVAELEAPLQALLQPLLRAGVADLAPPPP